MRSAKLILALILSLFALTARASEKILVLIPSSQSVKSIQKVVESGMPGKEVSVFAKFKDFEEFLKQNNPDLVFASDIFASESNGFERKATVTSGGSSESELILLSLDEKWKTADISEGKLGVIQLAERDDVKKYFERVFSKSFKKIQTVTKAEDLFPLLIFKTVDFIAVEPYLYNELKSRFTSKVFEIGKSKPISLPSAYLKKGSDAAIVEAFKKISVDELKKISFDGMK
jgi:hypothetical protein